MSMSCLIIKQVVNENCESITESVQRGMHTACIYTLIHIQTVTDDNSYSWLSKRPDYIHSDSCCTNATVQWWDAELNNVNHQKANIYIHIQFPMFKNKSLSRLSVASTWSFQRTDLGHSWKLLFSMYRCDQKETNIRAVTARKPNFCNVFKRFTFTTVRQVHLQKAAKLLSNVCFIIRH